MNEKNTVLQLNELISILEGSLKDINEKMVRDKTNEIPIEISLCAAQNILLSLKELKEFKKNGDTRIEMLQYKNLRKHFGNLIQNVLGTDYYNEGMDVYTCDELTCRDLQNKMKTFRKKRK